MSNAAIIAKNLSKKYKIYPSIHSRLVEAIHPLRKRQHEDFWALRDISFEVPKGQTFGVMGRNGSGKSTLLQLIAGVLYPTLGEVIHRGRISALLELGAGFNPEFSGRENVIILGAVMGLSKKEMERLWPVIEEFADIGQFVNQPVKTYSSGMYVRLAFAAAIHVEPEILIIDEALAVGDAKFQAKCFRKIEQFRASGKTILLVTHDANALVKFCDVAMLLDQGSLVAIDTTKAVVNLYSELLSGGILPKTKRPSSSRKSESSEAKSSFYHSNSHDPLKDFLVKVHDDDRCSQRSSYNPNEHRYGNRQAEIIDYFIVYGDQFDPSSVPSNGEMDLYLKIKYNAPAESPIYGMTIKNVDGVEIYGTNSRYSGMPEIPRQSGDCIIFKYHFNLNLLSGDYFFNIGVVDQGGEVIMDRRYDLIHINVYYGGHRLGIVDLHAQLEESSIHS